MDLPVQAQVINLLWELQRELRIAILFVFHDLTVVRHVSHRLIVLYKGRVMEYGDTRAVNQQALNPNTRPLLDAVPVPDPVVQKQRRTKGKSPRDGV